MKPESGFDLGKYVETGNDKNVDPRDIGRFKVDTPEAEALTRQLAEKEKGYHQQVENATPHEPLPSAEKSEKEMDTVAVEKFEAEVFQDRVASGVLRRIEELTLEGNTEAAMKMLATLQQDVNNVRGQYNNAQKRGDRARLQWDSDNRQKLNRISWWNPEDGTPSILKGMPAELLSDRKFLLSAVVTNPRVLKDPNLDSKYLTDRKFLLDAVNQSNGAAFRYFPEALYKDRAFVVQVMTKHGGAYGYAPSELQDNRDVVLAAVHSRGEIYDHLPDQFRYDREIFIAAAIDDYRVLEDAPMELQRDRAAILQIVQRKPSAIRYARFFRKDREITETALAKDRMLIEYVDGAILPEMEQKFGYHPAA